MKARPGVKGRKSCSAATEKRHVDLGNRLVSGEIPFAATQTEPTVVVPNGALPLMPFIEEVFASMTVIVLFVTLAFVLPSTC